jgi:uncharacterized membrane protein YuzA (DUF378 family)
MIPIILFGNINFGLAGNMKGNAAQHKIIAHLHGLTLTSMAQVIYDLGILES